ncbi:Calcium/proton exchanger CAX-like [Purpureocillium takamizusanense]|uniref:Vacuolar calcium ion transporter n=1 Tax=Purpureocillium takamizusanense TaxID=2060973 RepID=A0A9Q8QDH2_9HYPO|nr:Calcium/proton exchanger CAX-like [Purpureocillium takamizusanense]UNI16732.1 Calcium/proton exchanger CAX-like [Purpureocillium takamizusanense]
MDPEPNRVAGERTPLFADEQSSRDYSDVILRQQRPLAYTLFFDPNYTPGKDSDTLVVRSLAHVCHVTKVTLYSDYVNFLLVMVPIGIVAGAVGWSPATVFTLNFFAIIPLAAVLSFATEQIAMKLGESMGGLLNATFGNAVELIVSIVALKDGQIEVVQSSMLGSILSNLLLVMGMCFFLGGLCHRGRTGSGTEQGFSAAVAQTTCSLMTLSSASLVIPAAVALILSRATAIILLVLYILYLIFQLRTHSNLFDAEGQNAAELEAEEQPRLGAISAAAVLVVVTVLVSICAEYLVGSIDDLVDSANISKAFIGLILIPIVGNAAEHVTAVVVALRNKMDLAMGVAMGSSI